ncbi:hypothetical protein [Streptomyces collinus]|uniref:hypothetical protein n=1 Tax=Streptomyces collinus TaxID=42684 RepID=UPI0036EC924A
MTATEPYRVDPCVEVPVPAPGAPRHLGTTTWHGDDGLGLRHEADHLVDVEGDLDHPAPERSKHSGHDRFGPGDLGRLKENRRPGEYLIHDLVARALRQEPRPPDRPAGRRYGSLAVRRSVGPSARRPVSPSAPAAVGCPA